MKTNFLTLFILLITQALVIAQNIKCVEDDIIQDALHKAIALLMFCKIILPIVQISHLNRIIEKKERKLIENIC